ncbi:MAG: response regulator transcription factor [Bryobacteraceae bacterium]|nr:response regulator transcription factor [Bryobacteraceae bacterium]
MLAILLVEDQYFARLALHTVVDSREDMKIVAETASGAEALPLYRKHRPDLVIMDLRLPGMSGFDAIRAIRAEDAAARIVVLSNYDGSEDVHRALDAGALAYLTKDAGADDLIEALLAARRGRQYLPLALRGLLENRIPSDQLTARELEVLELLTGGMSNRDIGERLGIAEKTVRIHMTHIFDKMGVEDRTQAVLAAIQRGLVHLK